ncbi:hypothetical protein CCMA1212_006356 [Trichoderma ghanense]|uniref:Uncharacterized protein n=1 Tax=Trichoderma ghanense TaxID=65468 RepID=A0ABY2H3P5_9HYPO
MAGPLPLIQPRRKQVLSRRLSRDDTRSGAGLQQQHRPQHPRIVVRRRVDARARAVQLRLDGRDVKRREPAAVDIPQRHLGAPARRVREPVDAEARVVHAQRVEEVLLHVLAQRAARHRLERDAGPVHGRAVHPAVAGAHQERRVEAVLAEADRFANGSADVLGPFS